MSSRAAKGIAGPPWHTGGTLALATLALALLGLGWLGSQTALATFLGDTGKIAFQSNRDGNYEVYVMNVDGSRQTRLTHNPGFDGNPAWSFDGKRIAFQSRRGGSSDIYVMNAEGSGQVRLTDQPEFDGGPAWSRDGRRIAFRSDRDGNAEIYVMNADGSGQTNLTKNPADDFEPSWSPDGKRIAFRSERDGYAQIYVMNADGSGQTRISAGDPTAHVPELTGTPATDAFPAWSPDGGRIAFDHNRGDEDSDIYVMDVDGSNRTPLTDDLAPNGGPTWSPDAQGIAFRSSRHGNAEIYVMNADGSRQTRLTNNSWADHRPDWNHQPLPPSSQFSFGSLARNEKKGTATLAVSIPGPGEVILRRGKNVRWFARQANTAGPVGVRVRPRGRAKRRLDRAGTVRRRMRATVRARVTFRPAGGWPRTEGRRVRLVRVSRR